MTTPPKRLALLETACHQRQLEIDMLERAQYLGREVDHARLDELRTQELADEAEKASLTASWQQQKALIESIIALRAELMTMSTADDVDEDARSALQADLAAQYQALEAIAHHERLMHPQVDAEQIAEVIADWTGVPVDQMNTDELYKITHLTDILGAAIKGQDTAIERVHRHLLTARADLRRPGRPKGAFLLVGPVA